MKVRKWVVAQLAILIVLSSALVAGLCIGGPYHPGGISGTVSIVVRNDIEGSELINEKVYFSTGETVYDALNKVATVKWEDYPGFGKGIKSVNGLEATATEWWIFYVDGKPSDVACDKYGLHDGYNILVKYTNEWPF